MRADRQTDRQTYGPADCNTSRRQVQNFVINVWRLCYFWYSSSTRL